MPGNSHWTLLIPGLQRMDGLTLRASASLSGRVLPSRNFLKFLRSKTEKFVELFELSKVAPLLCGLTQQGLGPMSVFPDLDPPEGGSDAITALLSRGLPSNVIMAAKEQRWG